jgi:uncharacterized LabA/DUF88 family protein
VSKNVAVFVDVANIFYAAKAAGVDIDYVTLLKSATAGRDFVRAYAYTGLDPENENQRQFHSFLSRSGYKVISKDIRKYGDGRIKANLDIELVVDMMRMGQHLDIAVVVSGDGDFAPAIRAVQQMGVRVEVISFRGNTSSDLIDVADVFTDITQIARVEKGVRSGRRVAAEGDLSMTEVPEKETEGAARRRRTGGRRPEREDLPERGAPPERLEPVARATTEVGLPGNLIVLPGERLSRGAAASVAISDEREPDVELPSEEGESEGGREAAFAGPRDGDSEDGRRRRRRRGGRGRGRGRQDGVEQVAGVVAVGVDLDVDAEEILEDEEFLDEEIAPLPQHSTFGSVWDSQIGVNPAAPVAAAPVGNAGNPDDDEDFEDEPEIPEYLLAERRQQQQRGRGGRTGGMRPGGAGGGGRRAGYQAAMDRERYGRSAGSTGGGSGFAGGSLRPERSRPPMNTGNGGNSGNAGNRGPRPPQQQSRPSRPPYQDQPREMARPVQSSSEPWSEVPADVQEMLRAELARRQTTTGFNQSAPAPSRASAPVEPVAATRAPARGRGRSTAPRETAVEFAASETFVTEAPVTEAPAAPARRARRTAASAPVEVASATTEVVAKAAPRTRRTTAAAPAASPAPAEESTSVETAAPKARRAAAPRATAARSRTASAAATETAASAPEASSEAPAAPRKRAPRKTAADTSGSGEA